MHLSSKYLRWQRTIKGEGCLSYGLIRVHRLGEMRAEVRMHVEKET
jgi:hypothetical protein